MKINKKAAENMAASQLTGSALLQMFQLMATNMEVAGAEGLYLQYSFVQGLEDMEDGDLIPELHLSLRPFQTENIEVSEQGRFNAGPNSEGTDQSD